MKIKLPILFESDTTLHLEELNVGFKLKDCDIRETVFYSIYAIAPYREAGRDYTIIFTGIFDFICPKNVREVERIIQDNKALYGN